MSDKSLGTQILIGASAIAGLKSIGGPDESADIIDVTSLDSPDGYREFIQGFKDGGEVPISGLSKSSDTNGQIAMHTAYNTGAITAFTILLTNGMSWTFNGIVTAYKIAAELEDALAFEATIKVTGKPTLGVSASTGLSALSLTGTGGTLTPSFATGAKLYTFSGVSATSVTITATGAGQTIKLYVDGIYTQDLTSGAASAAIALPTSGTVKKLTIVANEDGKAPVVYEVVVVKTS